MNSDGGRWWYRQGIPGLLGGDDEFERSNSNSASQSPLTKAFFRSHCSTAATSSSVAKLQQPCQIGDWHKFSVQFCDQSCSDCGFPPPERCAPPTTAPKSTIRYPGIHAQKPRKSRTKLNLKNQQNLVHKICVLPSYNTRTSSSPFLHTQHQHTRQRALF